MQRTGDSALAKKNPIRYRSYYYDEGVGLLSSAVILKYINKIARYLDTGLVFDSATKAMQWLNKKVAGYLFEHASYIEVNNESWYRVVIFYAIFYTIYYCL